MVDVTGITASVSPLHTNKQQYQIFYSRLMMEDKSKGQPETLSLLHVTSYD